MKAYKYNEGKTLTWLESRVHKIANTVKEKGIHVKPGAVSATFVSSTLDSDSIDNGMFFNINLRYIYLYIYILI